MVAKTKLKLKARIAPKQSCGETSDLSEETLRFLEWPKVKDSVETKKIYGRWTPWSFSMNAVRSQEILANLLHSLVKKLKKHFALKKQMS